VEFPDDLLYGSEHLWVRREEEEGLVTLGITDYAQDQLGQIVYVDLPEVGDTVVAGDEMGAVESAKSVSDLISPVDGEVVEVNEDLLDDPSPINQDPYGAGWMVRVRLEGELPDGLLSAAEYESLVGE
jgi:glycine cleavage system H protein